MKRLAILEDRKKEIIGEIRRSDESKYDHRPHGVLLVANGLSPYRVSEVMGDSPKSVENWVNSFLKDGFGSLREPRRPGRPTRLSDIMDSISLDLRKNPMDLGYSQNLWDGKLLSHHLSLRYSVDLGTRQCQRIFRKLGFRLRKPRQKIAKGDSSHKEKLKKTRFLVKAGRSIVFIDEYSRNMVHQALMTSMDADSVSLEAQAAIEKLRKDSLAEPVIQSDNGSSFIAMEFKLVMGENHLTHKRIPLTLRNRMASSRGETRPSVNPWYR